jgi:hypothetical protein
MKRLDKPLPTFKHAIVLRNSSSTNVRLADKHLAELKTLLPHVSFVEAEAAKTKAETRARLQALGNLLGPNTLFCVAGGDGTVNLVIEFLLGDSTLSRAARRTPLLPLWAGNANDLAHMINGSGFRARLPALLASAKIVPVYPLECQLITSDGRVQLYHAISYAGFGVTAAVAKAINERTHRKRWWRRLHIGRFFGEMVTIGRTLLGSSGFTAEEDGSKISLYERTYVNGTRMGKLQPLAASLTERYFIQTTISKKDKHIFAVYRWLSGSMRPAPARKSQRASTFKTQDAIWMHADGETVRLPKNTRVTVRCTHMPVYVLSTRLR